MQSLHVYDYFCYRKWNLEGNFVAESCLADQRGGKEFFNHFDLSMYG